MGGDTPDWVLQTAAAGATLLNRAFAIGDSPPPFDVSQYQSVYVYVSGSGGNVLAGVTQQAGLTGGPFATQLDITSIGFDNNVFSQAIYQIPVVGNSMQVFSPVSNTGIINITVIGSNRPVNATKALGSNRGPRQLLNAVACVAGVPQILGTADSSAIAGTNFNGEVIVTYANSVAGTTFLYADYIDQANVLRSMLVAQIPASTNGSLFVAHPFGPCRWRILPGAAAVIGSFQIAVAPTVSS